LIHPFDHTASLFKSGGRPREIDLCHPAAVQEEHRNAARRNIAS